jgi:hypothetical protein
VPWDDEPEPVTQAVPVVRAEPATHADPLVPADDSVTKPMRSRPEHLLHAPAEAWHSDPIESWRHFPREDEPEEPVPARDPEPQSDSSRGILDELLSDALSLNPNRSVSRTTGFTSTRRSGSSRWPRLPRTRTGRRATNAPRRTTWPRTNRRRGNSGSSPTAGIPATTTPTMRLGTADIRCRAATS